MSRRPPAISLTLLLAWTTSFLPMGGAASQAFARQAPKQGSHAASAGRVVPEPGGRTMIDVTDLQTSPKALAEFHKAEDAIQHQDWAKAIERYQKALAIDPKFAAAYNNLGYAYARIGDGAHQREALDHAIELNRHAVEPLMNRGLLALQEKDKATAENLLDQAIRLDPQNAEALILLTRAQLMNAHYDEALVTVRQLDAAPHAKYPVIHYLAARAFEAERKIAQAAAQLRQFLQEEPQGARADAARQELAQLESTISPQ